MADQHSEPVPGAVGGRTEEPVRARRATHRPGVFTFAAVIMFVVAGVEALSALLAFAGTGWWVTSTGDLVYANYVFWGVIDLIIALIALYAGIDLLRGGGFWRGDGLPLRRGDRRQVVLCHPGGAGSICGGHCALRDGHLRARQALRLLREHLRTSQHRLPETGKFPQ